MKHLWTFGFLLAAVACVAAPAADVTPTPATPTAPAVPVTSTVTAPGPLPTPAPVRTPTTAPPPTQTPVQDPALRADQVYVYPRPLVSGDHATFDVVPLLPAEGATDVEVVLTLSAGETLTAPVWVAGFEQTARARFYWAWDTEGLSGTQLVTLTLALPPAVHDPDPTNNRLVLPITLEPRTQLAPPEPDVRWQITQTAGMRLYYLTGSAAARDLTEIVETAEAAYAEATAQMGPGLESPVDIFLLDRVVGQGGYAAPDWVAVSYVDRAYLPSKLQMTLVHELIHRLDAGIGCDEAPTLLREGLAVMISGGHYWPASLPRKAANLPGTERYIPLHDLVADFYLHQHEIGYLEAGAFLVYLEETLGSSGVETLCQTASSAAGTDRERLSAALMEAGLGNLAEVERDWLRWLDVLHPTEREARALEVEIRYLETLRAYQARHDRVAHFRMGVLFSPAAALSSGITADFVRDPDVPEAIALELLLRLAGEQLQRQSLTRADALLDDVEGALDGPPPWKGRAQDVLEIVEAALAQGYEPYRVLDKPVQGGWLIYALDRVDWPTQRLLWAAQNEAGRWLVTGPQ